MRVAIPFVLSTSLLCMSACDDSPAEREQKVENAADKTGDALKKAAEKTGDVLDKAAQSTGKALNDINDTASKVKVKAEVTTAPSTAPAVDVTTAPAAP